jgi:protein TonB
MSFLDVRARRSPRLGIRLAVTLSVSVHAGIIGLLDPSPRGGGAASLGAIEITIAGARTHATPSAVASEHGEEVSQTGEALGAAARTQEVLPPAAPVAPAAPAQRPSARTASSSRVRPATDVSKQRVPQRSTLPVSTVETPGQDGLLARAAIDIEVPDRKVRPAPRLALASPASAAARPAAPVAVPAAARLPDAAMREPVDLAAPRGEPVDLAAPRGEPVDLAAPRGEPVATPLPRPLDTVLLAPRLPARAAPVLPPVSPERVSRAAHEEPALDRAPRPTGTLAAVPSGGPAAPARDAGPAAASLRQLGPAGDQLERIPPAFDGGGLLNRPPRYPFLARRRGLEGRVILLVQVDAAGRPSAVGVQRSSGSSLLDDAAAEAVQHWRFAPARHAGVAVPGAVEVPIRFALTD